MPQEKMTAPTQQEQSTPLPLDYKPSPHTVLVGRGRAPKQNMGNKRIRVLAQSFRKQYQEGDKKCKSQIVSNIICMIRDACKGGKGAFVKREKDGRWYDLGDHVAREKVSYIFRDLLADQYKSSSKSKVARRQRPMTYFSPLSTFPKQDSTTMRGNCNGSVSTIRSSSSHCDAAEMDGSCQATCIKDISDTLFQSSAFLDNSIQEEIDIICRWPLEDWSPKDDYEMDCESLMKLPLL